MRRGLLGDHTLGVERVDRTEKMQEREQPEPWRPRDRADLLEPARLRDRGEHAPIGLVGRLGRELGADAEAHAGELAHERVRERVVELLLEVRACPRRRGRPDAGAGRIRGDPALEQGDDAIERDEAHEPCDQRALARARHRPRTTRAPPEHEHLAAAPNAS